MISRKMTAVGMKRFNECVMYAIKWYRIKFHYYLFILLLFIFVNRQMREINYEIRNCIKIVVL